MLTRRARCASIFLVLATFAAAACGEADEDDATAEAVVESSPGSTTGADSVVEGSPGSTTGAGSETSGEPIRFGAMFDQTGTHAPVGVPERQAFETMVDLINDAGGVDGRRLEVDIRDSQSSPDAAVEIARDFVREEYAAIFGPTPAAFCQAVQPIVEAAQVFTYCISPIGTLSDYLQLVDAPFQQVAGDITAQLFAERGWKRVACLATADASGEAYRKSFEAAAPNYGLELVANETFQYGDTDVTAQLTRIRSADPDVLFSCASGGNHIAVLTGMRQLDMDIPVFAGHGGVSFDVAKLAANTLPKGEVLSVGSWVMVPDQLPEDFSGAPLVKEFVAAYAEDHDGALPDTIGAYVADALRIVTLAVEAGADPSSGASISETVRGMCPVQGISFEFCFSEDNPRGVPAGGERVILRWNDSGGFDLVEVLDVQE